jgi:hypothetical protein
VPLGAPAATLLAGAFGLGLVGRHATSARLAGLVLAVLAVLWVCVLLVCGLLAAVVRGWRSVERIWNPEMHAGPGLLSRHWTISLVHAHPDDVADLLAQARAIAAAVNPRLPVAPDLRGRTPRVLCLLDGITSDVAKEMICAHPEARDAGAVRPPMVAFGELPDAAERTVNPAHGIFALLGGTLAVVLTGPVLLIGHGYDSCPGAGCGLGRRYLDALGWIALDLVPFQAAPPPFPADGPLQLLSGLVSLLGYVLSVAVVIAIRRHLAFVDEGRRWVTARLR